jgi:hypothetical protein
MLALAVGVVAIFAAAIWVVVRRLRHRRRALPPMRWTAAAGG